MKNRECPYCHKEISLKRCFLYIYRGTNYPTRCNHCSHKIMLVREPVPFIYCVCAGFLSIYIPTSLFLYFYHFSFWKAALCSLPFALICFIVCVVLTSKRLFFKRTDQQTICNITLRHFFFLLYQPHAFSLLHQQLHEGFAFIFNLVVEHCVFQSLL